jgi:hypothetical protein
MDKLNIHNEMACLDRKDRGFYDSLTDEERKKFSNYLMIRWASSVAGSRDMQEFYLISTNERLNRHFFGLNRHPRLQWLMATTISPDMGAQRHQWIAPHKKHTKSRGHTVSRRLGDLYPSMKQSDIDAWSRMITEEELAEYERESGG